MAESREKSVGWNGWHLFPNSNRYHYYSDRLPQRMPKTSLCRRHWIEHEFRPHKPDETQCCKQCMGAVARLVTIGWLPSDTWQPGE
jgi:hypothetical protein